MSKVNVSTARGTGPIARLKQEDGDASWVLGFYNTRDEAYIAEQAISGRFGLPQLVFNNAPVTTKGLIEQAWAFIGDNTERAIVCLGHFGRDLRYPLFRKGEQWQQSLKRPMVTHASNLMDGCLVLPYAGHNNAKKADWQPVTVQREHYAGNVYSFTINPYHTYVADGIVTHNCQSIMAFAGADSSSFTNAQVRTQAALLPLSICYRCPTSHLALAREIVPQIEARPNAPDGEISDLTLDKLPEVVQPGDMIICRLTAPLVAACIRLIERRIPARVRGRDIGKQLTDIIRAVEHMPSYTWREFGKWLDTYEQSQLDRLAQREGSESAMESLSDRCAAVRSCYEQFQAPDLDALCREIDALFDDGKPAVLLSTVHRAKGLEAERVFILRPDKLPLVWPKQQPWEYEQEQHIRYVALTRSTQALFWVWG